MKVLMTTDTVGGVWSYTLELIRALECRDVEVAMLAMGSAITPAQRAEAERCSHATLHTSEYRLEWMADPWGDVEEAGRWALEIAREFRPDIVHLNNYGQGHLEWPAPTLVVGHSCVYSWWEGVYGIAAPDPAMRWAPYRRRVIDALRRAALVVAPSRTMLSALERHYGPISRTQVIYNGRDASEFAPGAAKRPYIFSAGRMWDPAKNIDALNRIAGDLSWPVYVAGPRHCPCDETERQFEACAEFLGPRSPASVAGWMGDAAIYALPVKYEPFGLSILEAALSGCALVLGDIESMREIWNGAAVLVDPTDAGALRDSLRLLIDDDDRRVRLGRAARERALRYTASVMGAAYFDAYHNVSRVERRATAACGS